MSITQIIVFSTLCIIGLYDVFALMAWGEDHTVSRFVQSDILDLPVATFVVGVLFGHFGLLLPRKKKDE